MSSVVESLEKMPEIKAEKLIREHQAMLTALQSIRHIVRNSSYSHINCMGTVKKIVDETIGVK